MVIFLPLLEFILFFLSHKKTSNISYTWKVLLEKLISCLKKGNERKKTSVYKKSPNKQTQNFIFLMSPRDHLSSRLSMPLYVHYYISFCFFFLHSRLILYKYTSTVLVLYCTGTQKKTLSDATCILLHMSGFLPQNSFVT